MQVTLELLDKEIEGAEQRLIQATASVNQLTGGLLVLKNIRVYLEQEEPAMAEPSQDISPENKAEQERIEAAVEALSIHDIAEAVAGPGATVDEPLEIE